jgi:hypothetical protein
MRKTSTKAKVKKVRPNTKLGVPDLDARLCHNSGSELDQIQFLLGHVSEQTTKRHIPCRQRLRAAVNDKLGIEPG